MAAYSKFFIGRFEQRILTSIFKNPANLAKINNSGPKKLKIENLLKEGLQFYLKCRTVAKKLFNSGSATLILSTDD